MANSGRSSPATVPETALSTKQLYETVAVLARPAAHDALFKTQTDSRKQVELVGPIARSTSLTRGTTIC